MLHAQPSFKKSYQAIINDFEKLTAEFYESLPQLVASIGRLLPDFPAAAEQAMAVRANILVLSEKAQTDITVLSTQINQAVELGLEDKLETERARLLQDRQTFVANLLNDIADSKKLVDACRADFDGVVALLNASTLSGDHASAEELMRSLYRNEKPSYNETDMLVGRFCLQFIEENGGKVRPTPYLSLLLDGYKEVHPLPSALETSALANVETDKIETMQKISESARRAADPVNLEPSSRTRSYSI